MICFLFVIVVYYEAIKLHLFSSVQLGSVAGSACCRFLQSIGVAFGVSVSSLDLVLVLDLESYFLCVVEGSILMALHASPT